jgi:hypothetical protein
MIRDFSLSVWCLRDMGRSSLGDLSDRDFSNGGRSGAYSRPARHGLGGAAAILKRLHSAPSMAREPLMARLARDPKLPTKLRHRKMTAPRQTHKLLFLFH